VSQDKISIQLPSVERLVQRLVAAEKTNQKEIRITVHEARELVTDLSLLTTKLGKHIQEIHAKLDKLTPEQQQITVQMDGGVF
jgi:septation ring formation regulator EzrA